MRRIFCLRYALVTSLLIAILGLAGSPILQPDMANAAEEKQVSKTKKHVKYVKPKKKAKAKAKAAKKQPLRPWWCWDWPDCD